MFFKKKEETVTSVKVGGMSCEHCASHVKEALLSIKGVKKVDVSLKEATASITSNGPLDEASLKDAIESAGYEYLGLK